MSTRSGTVGSSLLLIVPLCLGLSAPASAAEPAPAPSAPKAVAPSPAKARAPSPVKAKAPSPAKALAPANISAAQVIKEHIAARGGGKAWAAVQALSLSGKMDAGTGDSVARSMRVARGPGAVSHATRREAAAAASKKEPEQQVQLPFTLAKQLPNKSRLEIEFAGKTAVQVYDGTNGWKVRPFLGRNEAVPFTPQEAKIEAESAGLGDPLIDAAAKGTKVEVAGVEPIDGRPAYKVKLTTTSGTVRHVWIDAKTFLDVKVEGNPRQLDGKLHAVWVYQRDFRSVQGVKIPFVQETVVDGFPQKHKVVLDKVVVNPKLGAATFAKPTV